MHMEICLVYFINIIQSNASVLMDNATSCMLYISGKYIQVNKLVKMCIYKLSCIKKEIMYIG